MYKLQAKSSRNERCQWIMHGAVSSDSDHLFPHTQIRVTELGSFRSQSVYTIRWVLAGGAVRARARARVCVRACARTLGWFLKEIFGASIIAQITLAPIPPPPSTLLLGLLDGQSQTPFPPGHPSNTEVRGTFPNLLLSHAMSCQLHA